MHAELRGAACDGRPEEAERCMGGGRELGRGAPQKRRDLSWAFISNGVWGWWPGWKEHPA